MGAFLFAGTLSGIPERILAASGSTSSDFPCSDKLQERQQYCLFIFIVAHDFHEDAC
jgi:hypothetical protein